MLSEGKVFQKVSEDFIMNSKLCARKSDGEVARHLNRMQLRVNIVAWLQVLFWLSYNSELGGSRGSVSTVNGLQFTE